MAEQGYKCCKRCEETKPLGEFYPHKRLKDGHTNECKVCVCGQVSKWQKANRKRANERKLRWSRENRERVTESKKRWEEENREQVNASSARMRRLYPEKVRARLLLNNAVRDGRTIKPKVCAGCGEEPEPHKLHGHHPDYRKPLEVEWLCVECHAGEHMG